MSMFVGAPSWGLRSDESVRNISKCCLLVPCLAPRLALFLHRVFALRYDLSLPKSFGKVTALQTWRKGVSVACPLSRP